MRPVRSPALRRTLGPTSEEASQASEDEWTERAGRLYVDLEQPARAMIRRAFRGAFSDDEIDDVYAGAWVGTLRALARRHRELDDEQIRKYVLAAVANQASKELRRRKRKPTAPLELVDAVADDARTPDERAVVTERSRIARDLLTSLPPRRRAVMLLRYGWGLEPRQVCELVRISPRAYRKEVTRGVDQLVDRMQRVERGEWCAERGAVLKAYAAGLAGAEERRQAEAHIAHCRGCTEFVARLRGRLHDIGAGLALPVALDALYGEESLITRIGDLGERGREALGGLLSRGGSDGVGEAVTGIAGSGGSRGIVSAAGAGLLARLAEVGTAGKVAVACLAGGAAATACVGTGVVPGIVPGAGSGDRERSAPREPGSEASAPDLAAVTDPVPEEAPEESVVESEDESGEAQDDEEASETESEVEAFQSVEPAELEFEATTAGTGSSGGGGGGSGGDEFERGFETGAGGGSSSSGGGEFGGP